MIAKPGAVIPLLSIAADPWSGSGTDQSVISWLIYRNGNDITNLCGVSNSTDIGSPAGVFKATFTVPLASVEGDQIQVIETVTVSGVTASRENCRFTVVSRLPGELALATDMSTAVAGVGNIYSDTTAIKAAVNSTGVVVAAGSKSGYSLASTYDAAKTAAQASDITALLTTQFGAEEYPPPGTRPNLVSALLLILALLTRKTISGTTLTVYKLDGTTAATFTLTPDEAPVAFNAITRVS